MASSLKEKLAKLRLNPQPGRSSLAKSLLLGGVPHTPELERILRLPRRSSSEPFPPSLSSELSHHIFAPSSPERGLRPVQAESFHTIDVMRGMLGMIGVGEGKTLISQISPFILDLYPALLMVPGGLVKKTKVEFDWWAETFRIRIRPPSILSYQLLSHPKHQQDLLKLRPRLIVLDEAHHAANPFSALSTRLAEYLEAFPETVVIAMSGTLIERSLLDIHHLLQWTLGPDASPLPRTREECAVWAQALDHEVPFGSRRAKGALKVFDEGGGFGVYLRNTLGVVVGGSTDVGASIRYRVLSFDLGADIKRHLAAADDGVRPDGEVEFEAATLSSLKFTLSLGFWLRWKEPGPPLWMEKRRRWGQFVRWTLEQRLPNLDSEEMVRQAYGDSTQEGKEWFAIEPSFVPETEVVWLDRSIIPAVIEKSKLRYPLIWCAHPACASLLNPYFGAGGKDLHTGRSILDVTKPVTAGLSIEANIEGKNLQHLWHENLLLDIPKSASTLEQLIARTHRPGQRKDEVVVTFYAPTAAHRERIAFVKQQAQWLEQFKGKKQKLQIGDWEI